MVSGNKQRLCKRVMQAEHITGRGQQPPAAAAAVPWPTQAVAAFDWLAMDCSSASDPCWKQAA